jgi:hypothetical protein
MLYETLSVVDTSSVISKSAHCANHMESWQERTLPDDHHS